MFDFPHDATLLTAEFSGPTVEIASMMADVKDAISADRLELAYQPVIDTRVQNGVAFYEGLIRLFDAQGNLVPAGSFMPMIEDLEEGRLVDVAAIKLGLAALRADPSMRLSINLSPRSIVHPGWNAAFAEALAADPTVADRLILEITESSMINAPKALSAFMKRFQALGVSFALDDFGAGYTAFSHFKTLNFDIVKIDRAFVDGIADDRGNQVIMGALKTVADQFEIMVVAEGIERAEDMTFLQNVGVEMMQGYYFAKPALGHPNAVGFAKAG